MSFSRSGVFISIVLLSLLLSSCAKPIAVTHWTAKDRAMTRKGQTAYGGKKPFGYPNHPWYSRIVCFDDKCRKKAAWVKKQRSHRFKGFKDGGKLPPPPVRTTKPEDTVLIAAKPVKTTSKPKTTAQQKQQPSAPVIQQQSPLQTPPLVETVSSDSLIVLNEVLFAVNSYKLRPELYPKLDSIVTFLTKNKSTKIEISGHTDATGNEAHNLKLSENRADAVAEYLVDRGVETSRVSFNGFGSSRPIAPNNTEQGRKKNRRVEILIHNRK